MTGKKQSLPTYKNNSIVDQKTRVVQKNREHELICDELDKLYATSSNLHHSLKGEDDKIDYSHWHLAT